MAKRALAAGYRQRKDGKYESRFTINGKRYSVYADTLKECKEKDAELREKIKSGLYVNNRNITLNQYYEEWKAARQGTIKGNTALNIESRYRNHIGPAMGHRKVVDIEKREIVHLQKQLAQKQKATTVNITIVQLKSIFNAAVADGIISRNPAAGVKPLKLDEETATKTYHRALTEEEQSAFMEQARQEWLYELIALLLCTGMRVGEATALTWNDIDYANNVIHVTKTISRTAAGEYTIGTPKSKTSIRNILRRINRRGIEIEHFSAHALRDTFATRYIEQGGSPQVLKTILGHSSLSMTMDLYSHVLPNTKQEEMNNINIAL